MTAKEYIIDLIKGLNKRGKVFITLDTLDYYKLKINQIRAITEASGLNIKIRYIENIYRVYKIS